MQVETQKQACRLCLACARVPSLQTDKRAQHRDEGTCFFPHVCRDGAGEYGKPPDFFNNPQMHAYGHCLSSYGPRHQFLGAPPLLLMVMQHTLSRQAWHHFSEAIGQSAIVPSRHALLCYAAGFLDSDEVRPCACVVHQQRGSF